MGFLVLDVSVLMMMVAMEVGAKEISVALVAAHPDIASTFVSPPWIIV